MYLKIFIVSILSIISFFFLSQTEIYYQYCKNSIETGDFLVEEDVHMYKHICLEHYRDYSSHFLMNNTVNVFYNFMAISSNQLLNITDKKYLKKRIKNQDLSGLELYLRIHKFIRIALYIICLYVGIIILPNLFIDLMSFLFNKLLFFIFAFLFGETIYNYIADTKLDSYSMIKEYAFLFDFEYMLILWKNLMSLMGLQDNNRYVERTL